MKRVQFKSAEELREIDLEYGKNRFGGDEDWHWMSVALSDAEAAGRRGEVPIGAVVVIDGKIIGRSGNATEVLQDATAHAEMLALRQACAALGSRRLLDATLYATLEPCAMCAGAIVLARVPRLVFGASDPKAGACGSLRNVVADPRLNHRCQVRSGVLDRECTNLLKDFFAALRSSK